MREAEVINWLMEGDPAIRWQVMRDLVRAPAGEVAREQERVASEGWGRRLIERQAKSGRWADEGPGEFRGLYSPKWTSTTYTLVLLRRLGLKPGSPAAISGCDALVRGSQWFDAGDLAPWSSPRSDMCVNAMVLGVLEWFGYDEHARRDGLLSHLLDHQRLDGGWNCRHDSRVSSVHTTISTLEALQVRRRNTPDPRVDGAIAGGQEYLLKRKLFRSLRTGEVIHPSLAMLSFPPRWKYDVLRALDHLQDAGTPPDSRAVEAIDLLKGKQRKDGTWPVQNRHPGAEHFQMEVTGAPSRWNTLRVLRVLRWAES
jgi:hypothetical protein